MNIDQSLRAKSPILMAGLALVAGCLLLTSGPSALAADPPVTLEFDTELLSLNVSGGPIPMPLASDPGNALGDSISGYGWVDSQVTITLSSGPQSLGKAFASNVQHPGTVPMASSGPFNPSLYDGDTFYVDSFFDVFFDITVTDIDTRAGRDFAGQLPGASFVIPNNSQTGTRDMQTSYSQMFDLGAPNYGLIPPPEVFPYIGHFNIEIPLGGDINGNGENDKIKFTLAAHQVNDMNRTFITLPNGTVIDNFDSEADLSGAVVDMSSDPPFTMHLEGPSSASSLLLNPTVPEPSSLVLLALGGLLPLACRARRCR